MAEKSRDEVPKICPVCKGDSGIGEEHPCFACVDQKYSLWYKPEKEFMEILMENTHNIAIN